MTPFIMKVDDSFDFGIIGTSISGLIQAQKYKNKSIIVLDYQDNYGTTCTKYSDLLLYKNIKNVNIRIGLDTLLIETQPIVVRAFDKIFKFLKKYKLLKCVEFDFVSEHFYVGVDGVWKIVPHSYNEISFCTYLSNKEKRYLARVAEGKCEMYEVEHLFEVGNYKVLFEGITGREYVRGELVKCEVKEVVGCRVGSDEGSNGYGRLFIREMGSLESLNETIKPDNVEIKNGDGYRSGSEDSSSFYSGKEASPITEVVTEFENEKDEVKDEMKDVDNNTGNEKEMQVKEEEKEIVKVDDEKNEAVEVREENEAVKVDEKGVEEMKVEEKVKEEEEKEIVKVDDKGVEEMKVEEKVKEEEENEIVKVDEEEKEAVKEEEEKESAKVDEKGVEEMKVEEKVKEEEENEAVKVDEKGVEEMKVEEEEKEEEENEAVKVDEKGVEEMKVEEKVKEEEEKEIVKVDDKGVEEMKVEEKEKEQAKEEETMEEEEKKEEETIEENKIEKLKEENKFEDEEEEKLKEEEEKLKEEKEDVEDKKIQKEEKEKEEMKVEEEEEFKEEKEDVENEKEEEVKIEKNEELNVEDCKTQENEEKKEEEKLGEEKIIKDFKTEKEEEKLGEEKIIKDFKTEKEEKKEEEDIKTHVEEGHQKKEKAEDKSLKTSKSEKNEDLVVEKEIEEKDDNNKKVEDMKVENKEEKNEEDMNVGDKNIEDKNIEDKEEKNVQVQNVVLKNEATKEEIEEKIKEEEMRIKDVNFETKENLKVQKEIENLKEFNIKNLVSDESVVELETEKCLDLDFKEKSCLSSKEKQEENKNNEFKDFKSKENLNTEKDFKSNENLNVKKDENNLNIEEDESNENLNTEEDFKSKENLNIKKDENNLNIEEDESKENLNTEKDFKSNENLNTEEDKIVDSLNTNNDDNIENNLNTEEDKIVDSLNTNNNDNIDSTNIEKYEESKNVFNEEKSSSLTTRHINSSVMNLFEENKSRIFLEKNLESLRDKQLINENIEIDEETKENDLFSDTKSLLSLQDEKINGNENKSVYETKTEIYTSDESTSSGGQEFVEREVFATKKIDEKNFDLNSEKVFSEKKVDFTEENINSCVLNEDTDNFSELKGIIDQKVDEQVINTESIYFECTEPFTEEIKIPETVVSSEKRRSSYIKESDLEKDFGNMSIIMSDSTDLQSTKIKYENEDIFLKRMLKRHFLNFKKNGFIFPRYGFKEISEVISRFNSLNNIAHMLDSKLEIEKVKDGYLASSRHGTAFFTNLIPKRVGTVVFCCRTLVLNSKFQKERFFAVFEDKKGPICCLALDDKFHMSSANHYVLQMWRYSHEITDLDLESIGINLENRIGDISFETFGDFEWDSLNIEESF